jgi:hypothetical protein
VDYRLDGKQFLHVTKRLRLAASAPFRRSLGRSSPRSCRTCPTRDVNAAEADVEFDDAVNLPRSHHFRTSCCKLLPSIPFHKALSAASNVIYACSSWSFCKCGTEVAYSKVARLERLGTREYVTTMHHPAILHQSPHKGALARLGPSDPPANFRNGCDATVAFLLGRGRH